MTWRVNADRRLLERGLVSAVLLVFGALLLAPASAAYAFGPPISDTDEPFSKWTCDQCHASSGEGTTWTGSGAHKGYVTTASKCVVCHSVHAATSVLLLPATTISQTCLTCHDGTASGIGPYDSIEAHGGVVAGEHTIGVSTMVPGGSGPLGDTLGCGDCHAVHGVNTVVAFARDSGRAQDPDGPLVEIPVTSDALLRNDVNGAAPGTYAVYGAQWCASCHDQLHSDSAEVMNHPVDQAYDWGYGDVITTASATGMGRTNAGYIMAPVAEAGDGRIRLEDRRDPMCQQCHEDARNVEEIFDASTAPYVNPAFLTFPHQTTSQFMLAESHDDLCTNCHAVSTLP